jgi:hypothetical protein
VTLWCVLSTLTLTASLNHCDSRPICLQRASDAHATWAADYVKSAVAAFGATDPSELEGELLIVRFRALQVPRVPGLYALCYLPGGTAVEGPAELKLAPFTALCDGRDPATSLGLWKPTGCGTVPGMVPLTPGLEAQAHPLLHGLRLAGLAAQDLTANKVKPGRAPWHAWGGTIAVVSPHVAPVAPSAWGESVKVVVRGACATAASKEVIALVPRHCSWMGFPKGAAVASRGDLRPSDKPRRVMLDDNMGES